MNSKRLVVLGIALVAASAAAFLARGLVGGGTPKVEAKPAPQIAMNEILVANSNLQPGQALTQDQVRWEKWPATSVDPSFINHASVASAADAVRGVVVRSPLVAGQPITSAAVVHADAAGFMAAMLSPGMRAVSINISTDSGAGGFILPNDRVDLILIRKTTDTPPLVRVKTILSSIRVLAVDQTFKQEKDIKTVVGKTATLEVTPAQAELVEKAQSQGPLSLSLRPLGDNNAVAANQPASPPVPDDADDNKDDSGAVSVIRYGVSHDMKKDHSQ